MVQWDLEGMPFSSYLLARTQEFSRKKSKCHFSIVTAWQKSFSSYYIRYSSARFPCSHEVNVHAEDTWNTTLSPVRPLESMA